MSVQNDVSEAWKVAMKARDPQKDVLSLIRTELKNHAINNRPAGSDTTEIDDDTALKVLTKMGKQRRESISEFEKGGREDLAEKEKTELKVIERFLPAQLSEEAVEQIVKSVIADTGATSMADMGKVMGPAMAKCAGQAGGKAVQAAVKKLLA